MADVYLRSDGGQEIVDLPLVCMKCGAPSTVRKSKLFSWMSQANDVADFLANFPGMDLVVVVALLKRQRVQTTLCDQHKSYWWKYPLLMWLLVLGMLGFDVVVVFGVAAAFNGNGEASEMARPVTAVVVLSFAVLELAIILGILMTNRRIRPTEISKRHIRLTGVSADFADAVEDLEAAQQERETHST